MRRVVATFVLLALVYSLGAYVMRGEFGLSGAIATGSVPVLAIVVGGVPAFAFLRRRGWLAWWHVALGGGAIGLVCTLPFVVGGAALVAGLAPAFTGLGIVNGLVFWALGIWRNGNLVRDSRPTSGAPRSPAADGTR